MVKRSRITLTRGKKKPGLNKVEKSQVNRMIGKKTETRYRRVNFVSLSATNTAQLLFLNGTDQGDDITNRNGRQVRFFKWHVNANISIGDNTQIVRLVMVQDRAPNGVFPEWLDVFHAENTDGMPKIESRARFVIHYDKTFPMVQTDASEVRILRIRKTLRLPKTWYTGTTNSITHLEKNGLFLFYISNSTVIPHPQINGFSELYFKDD